VFILLGPAPLKQLGPPAPVDQGRFDKRGNKVGLDPDQLSLQAPFPESLPAPMAGSPMARQLAPGGFMLRSGRPACGPVSLLAQESGRPQLRLESALLFSGWPHDLFGLIILRQGPQKQQDVKKEAFEPDDKGAQIRGPERTAVRMDINFLRQGA
jgi:hypothetical protein